MKHTKVRFGLSTVPILVERQIYMSGRYAKLNRDWSLRGWLDWPVTMVNVSTGEVRRLTKMGFYVAKSCDGTTDFHSLAFIPAHNSFLDALIDEGIAEACREGDSIKAWQRYRKATNPHLIAIHWCVTGLCNLNCRHCCMESPSRRYGQLPFAEMARFVEQFEQANVVMVSLSGGEPFFRKDILDIMALLAEKKLLLSRIYTNGLLICEEHLQGIVKLGFRPSFQVSYDGIGTHDWMRGTEGIEQRTIDAIRRLCDARFSVIVSTSIDRVNVGRLMKTYDLMKALAVHSWRISSPQKAGNWRRSITETLLNEEAQAYQAILSQWLKDGKPFELQLSGFFRSGPTLKDELQISDGLSIPSARSKSPPVSHRVKRKSNGQEDVKYTPESFDCGACHEQLNLLPDGTLLPCPGYTDTHIKKRFPNLLREDLTNVWAKSFLRDIAEMKKKDLLPWNPECVDCEHFKECGMGCRASALTETGDLMSKDPLMCEVYKKGYKKRFEKMAERGCENAIQD